MNMLMHPDILYKINRLYQEECLAQGQLKK